MVIVSDVDELNVTEEAGVTLFDESTKDTVTPLTKFVPTMDRDWDPAGSPTEEVMEVIVGAAPDV